MNLDVIWRTNCGKRDGRTFRIQVNIGPMVRPDHARKDGGSAMAYRVVCKEHGVTLSVSRKGAGQSYTAVHCPCLVAHDRYQRDGQINLLTVRDHVPYQPRPQGAYK
jgi:hypothetical protein